MRSIDGALAPRSKGRHYTAKLQNHAPAPHIYKYTIKSTIPIYTQNSRGVNPFFLRSFPQNHSYIRFWIFKFLFVYLILLKQQIMIKVRLILMFQGKVEHDIETQMIRPRLKEVITLPEHGEHYPIKFIQHFFNEQGEFQYLMITGVRKV